MEKFKATVLIWETSNIQQETVFYIHAANLIGAKSKLTEFINDNFQIVSLYRVINIE